MELILQQGLQHQQRAVDSIRDALRGVGMDRRTKPHENPRLDASGSGPFQSNVRDLQGHNNIPREHRGGQVEGDCLNIDIKMETGTGKTYVYTKAIYELHRHYGFNKFIIAVPSLAIKAGVSQFLNDGYVQKHFADTCGYGALLDVGVLEAVQKKKGKQFFPAVVREFFAGSWQDTKRIHVMLLNMQLLTGTTMLTRDDYGYGLEGLYRPLDAIAATGPVVIIDEPHRFARSQKAFKVISEDIRPQLLIRFGATFPETTTGRGKNKTAVKDYSNLLYDLNACESFNQGLIKGVAKEHFEPTSGLAEKVKVASIANRDSAVFHYRRKDAPPKSFTLGKDDSLGIISAAFEGVTITNIGTSSVVFSNGLEKHAGEEMDVEVYMHSYQEAMLRLALQRHFETERQNFCNRQFKIKSLALFFIDDISSYRQGADGKDPYLRNTFERLLRERVASELDSLGPHDSDYGEYLKATLEDVSASHAGYFSQDNDDSDAGIAQEVQEILFGKKQLLSLKTAAGKWNTRRFLFSKWTLKEGWDNPNVFTIAKLRSSGSEISKLQEVGRGLRLPIDECGNRISNEGFLLNYIVDFTEADFAQRLIAQINSEIPQALKLSEERLCAAARKLGITGDALFMEILNKGYIDRHSNIKADRAEAFFGEYPDLAAGLALGKVCDRNSNPLSEVKLRHPRFEEIKRLWNIINTRYLLGFNNELNAAIDKELPSILADGVFTDTVITSVREIIKGNDSGMVSEALSGVQYTADRPIPYCEFLKRSMAATNIPITAIHRAMVSFVDKHGQLDAKHINEASAARFASKFIAWKNSCIEGNFHYNKTNIPIKATALTNADGSPKESITLGRIGRKIAPGEPASNYLYDKMAYDSPLELENIKAEIEEVVVFGKIPRNSIAIPTTTGGFYSPDFMYVVQRTNGDKELNIVVETKDVDSESQLRGEEAEKIKCAKVFFDALSAEGYQVRFHTQIRNMQMRQIINSILTD